MMKKMIACICALSTVAFHTFASCSAESEKPIQIDNEFYHLGFSSDCGLITQISDKTGGFPLITEPRLAGNFALAIPLADFPGNIVDGRSQKLSSVEKLENGLKLTWASPLVNAHGSYDVKVSMKVLLNGPEIRFQVEVQNNSPYMINEVRHPVIGGMSGVGERTKTKITIPLGGWTGGPDSFCHIAQREYLFPYGGFLPMPWMDFYNPDNKRGLYFGAHDDIARYKQLRFEMTPGFAPNRAEDTWPTSEELAGAPAGLTMHWTSYPFLKTGQSFVGPGIILEGHAGDWHQGAAIYRKWFTATHTLNDYRNDWLHQSMAFQDTMFLLPEGNVLLTFKDIPRWARDARKYGIETVLISGWNVGGHDSNYPLYEPDPRLGTWEELRKSVQKCHEMGMKVFFFVNFQPVDVDTDWYHRELYKYAGTESYIDPYAKMPGWGMGTLSARLGYTARRLTWVDMAYPEYREIIIRQMVKLAEIGADGLHLDKFLGMGPSGWPGADVSPDQMGAKALKLGLDELLSRCRKVQPHFSLSAEGTIDLGLQWFDVSWGWHFGTHTSVYKYTLPQWMPTMAIVQPWDYNSVNQAMRYGFQFFCGPGYYTESMDYKPWRPLSEYIRETLRIREKLKDTIFMGDFIDNQETRVEAIESDLVQWGSFRNPQTGKRACVLMNMANPNTSKTFTPTVAGFEGNISGKVRLYQPFEKERTASLPVQVAIPPERFVIVVEE